MWPYREETELDELEQQLSVQLGRELTAREKFYVALSQACMDKNEAYDEDPYRKELDQLKAA